MPANRRGDATVFRVRTFLRASILVAVLSFPSLASATRGVTGYSGKPYNGNRETCAQCHSGGTAPTVTITNVGTVTAGSTNQVTVRVSGNLTAVNIAMADGTEVTPIQNLRLEFPANAELVANPAPIAENDYRFSFKAPQRNGTHTIWATGLTSNNNSATSGDGVRSVTQTFTVTGGSDSEPGPGGGGESSEPPPRDAGYPSSSVVDGGGGGSSDGDGGTSGGGGGGNNANTDDDEFYPKLKDDGCSMGALAGSSAVAGWFVALGLSAMARRRARKRAD